MKKILSLVTIFALLLALSASAFAADSDTVFKVGICNYVDDASLNQIVENIVNQLDAIGKEKSVTFDISYDNCNADANVMAQIIQNFIADDVDLMVGVATPVAMNMQAATEDNGIPVVFAAVVVFFAVAAIISSSFWNILPERLIYLYAYCISQSKNFQSLMLYFFLDEKSVKENREK